MNRDTTPCPHIARRDSYKCHRPVSGLTSVLTIHYLPMLKNTVVLTGSNSFTVAGAVPELKLILQLSPASRFTLFE